MSTSYEEISHSLIGLDEGNKSNAKVLVVDDLSFERKLLVKLVNDIGYAAIEAEDGIQGIEVFQRELPDIILMDIQMPNMDGKESAKRIKKICKDNYVPIIFLTGLTEENSIVDCMNAGGDDFLIKPYSAVILKAKIRGLLRTREMYSLIREQKEKLEHSQESNLLDMQVAEKIIANISRFNELLNFNNIKYTILPMEILSGDLILAARTPNNGQAFLVADFTGHGLAAAIGAMVVSEIFYSMIAKGFRLSDITSEINRKLNNIMPTGRFMSACLLEVHPEFENISVVNAGLPDVLICGVSGEIKHRIVSKHVPLGVLPNEKLDIQVENYEICQGEKVYAYSDGIIEAPNSEGELFGVERLISCIEQNRNATFEKVLVALDRFRGRKGQTDDISVMEIRCDISLLESSASTKFLQENKAPKPWEFKIKLDEDMLKEVNPLPVILHIITEFQGLETQRENLYTILSELYSNALEHGILKLDSRLKENPNGFAEYYALRKERLSSLEEGSIEMYFSHIPIEHGGKLTVNIHDTGAGFDHDKVFSSLDDNPHAYGRGIALIRNLADSLKYSNAGKSVEFQYSWSAG